jgi:hypothetical protein
MDSLKFRSPDGAHIACLEYAGEIRFGPAYYSLKVDSTTIAGKAFGREAVWSEDSRYLAVQLWLSTTESEGPHTVLLCVDLHNWRGCQVSAAHGGFIKPKCFVGNTLIYTKEKSGQLTEFEIDFPVLPRWVAL